MSNNDNRRHFQPEKKYEIAKEVIMGKNPVKVSRLYLRSTLSLFVFKIKSTKR